MIILKRQINQSKNVLIKLEQQCQIKLKIPKN